MLVNINAIVFGMQKIPYPNNNTRIKNNIIFFTQYIFAKYPILRIFFPSRTKHAMHIIWETKQSFPIIDLAQGNLVTL
jgi:hypothetical protein